jgi:hypothetical protein
MKQDSAFQRAPRPLILWAGVALVAGGTAFVLVVLAAIAIGFWMTAARGQGVPDLSGGLGALAGAAVTVGAFIAQVLNQRHVERRDLIARGGAPNAPFDQAQPSPDGLQINPHGGPDAP